MEQKPYIEEEQSISLKEIYEIIKKRFLLLVLTTLIGGLLVGGYAFFVATPKYKSQGAIMVQVRSGGEESPVNTVESQRLVQSTIDILSQIDLIPNEASIKLKNEKDLEYSAKTIKKGMSVSNKSNSLVIFINFISTNQEDSKIVVDEVIESLISVTSHENYRDTLKDNITKLDVSEGKYDSPNKLLFTFVGLLLGGVIGLVYVFIVEMVNSGYKDKEEFEQAVNIQVLAVVPEYKVEARQQQ